MELLRPERTFEPYSTSHWILIALIVGGALAMALAGRRYRHVAAVRTHARVFAVVIVVLLLPVLIHRSVPPRWELSHSLPLHLCDLAWMVAAYALWSGQQWAYAATYYWGLTLTPQAVITPALDAPGFPHVDFLEFWAQHLLVIWAAAYLTWGVGRRPGWRDYRSAVAVTLVWMAVTLAFNAAAGTNYGFLSRKPDHPSMLDLLGEWPWYLAVEVAVGMAGWALVTWPWTRRRPPEGRSSGGPEPSPR